MSWWILGLLVAASSMGETAAPVVRLPPPRTDGAVSLETAIAGRRSIRTFAPAALNWGEIGQLLWAAQGITHDPDKRAAPSAGATYPLELYVATEAGLFQYRPKRHELAQIAARDVRGEIQRAAGGQEAVDAPAVFVFTAVPARTAGRYRERATRYIQIEVGHAAQNLLLEAVSMQLGAVTVGAFSDSDLQRALALPTGQVPLYIIPVGRPAR